MRTRFETIIEINELLEKYKAKVWSEDDFFEHSFSGNETINELEEIALEIAKNYHIAQAYKKAYYEGNGWEL